MTVVQPAKNHYPTPPEATRALLSVERFSGCIWEPCAGTGAMSDVLLDAGYDVYATTLEMGTGKIFGNKDFLLAKSMPAQNIVTNPPFNIAEEIIRHALSFRPVKTAMLLNIKFLASVGRARGLWMEFPPSRVWVLADRVTMYPADWEGPKNSTTETHAWFVWDASHIGVPSIGWLVAGDHKDATA